MKLLFKDVTWENYGSLLYSKCIVLILVAQSVVPHKRAWPVAVQHGMYVLGTTHLSMVP